jgi:hypothetical protein
LCELAGGTILNVLAELMARGASQEYIRIITILVAPPALEAIAKQFPGECAFHPSTTSNRCSSRLDKHVEMLLLISDPLL